VLLIGFDFQYFFESRNKVKLTSRKQPKAPKEYQQSEKPVYRRVSLATPNDRVLAVAIRDAIEAHDISCGYFTKGFDIGFLNARLVWHGERKMESMPHFDVMWGYKGWRGLKIGSSSMKNVSEYLGLDEQKMGVPKEIWVRAGTGDTEALDVIVERCESDVRVTLEIANHSLKNKLVKNPFAVYP